MLENQQDTIEGNRIELTFYEVTKAIKTLKHNKTPGPGGIVTGYSKEQLIDNISQKNGLKPTPHPYLRRKRC